MPSWVAVHSAQFDGSRSLGIPEELELPDATAEPAAGNSGDSRTSGGGSLIGIIAGLAAALLVGALAVVVVLLRRRNPEVPNEAATDSPEPTVSFDGPMNEELECENPLGSEENGESGGGSAFESDSDEVVSLP
jgi:hypothetical protein